MHFIVSPIGSAGDVHPMLGFALELRRRGHDITFVVSGFFRELVERLDLPYVELGTSEQCETTMNHPDLWHPMRAFSHIYNSIVRPNLKTQYDAFVDNFREGESIGLVSALGFGGLIAGEKWNIPLATIHLQPAVFWSNIEPPILPGMSGPRVFRRFQCWLGERFIIDRTVCPSVNSFREELGLSPVRQTTRWWHSPDCVLALFPDWYAKAQPDWPPNVVQTGFPLWDEDNDRSLPDDVENFLSGGDPPLVFTPGSANTFASSFFEAAVAACQSLGRRGVLLTRFAEQIPSSLPPEIRHFEYVPLEPLLSRAAALIHHGGVGTTAQGLSAGLPQLIMPLAHDQFDNAARLKRFGVGDSLVPARFRAPQVTNKLQHLLTSRDVKQSCQQIAAKFVGQDGIAAAADALEDFARKRYANA